MVASRDEINVEVSRGKFCTAQALDAVRDPIFVIDISDARFNVIFANAAARGVNPPPIQATEERPTLIQQGLQTDRKSVV